MPDEKTNTISFDISPFFENARQKATKKTNSAMAVAKVERDEALYKMYVASGLTVEAFARSQGMTEGAFRYFLRKYDLPQMTIDSHVLRKAARKGRKQVALFLASKCDCICAKLVRQTLESEKRFVA